MLLTQNFIDNIQIKNLFTKKDKLLIAVSGGVDSVTLCELCYQAGFKFEMAHCNFLLRGVDSDADAIFVQQLAQKYQVPFHIQIFDTNKIAATEKKSIEETARNIRYNWFAQLIEQSKSTNNPIQYLLTAHHANDDVETAAMNFFRGTGIKGLRGILERKNNIIRPLLFATKKEIIAFAKQQNLEFVTDTTNAQSNFTRNYFRNEVLPMVEKVYPKTQENIAQNIQKFKEIEILYQQAIEQHKKKLIETKGNEIHIPILKLLKTTSLQTVLYEILNPFNFTTHQVSEVIRILKSTTGKFVESDTHRAIKNRNWLIVSPIKSIEAQHILIDENDTQIHYEQGTIKFKKLKFNAQTTIHININIALIDEANIQFPLLLRKWKQGDYFYPLGMQKKKKLSKFFIDNKLSLTQKENVWVLEMDKKIIWIIGLRIDDRFKIAKSTNQFLQITYQPK